MQGWQGTIIIYFKYASCLNNTDLKKTKIWFYLDIVGSLKMPPYPRRTTKVSYYIVNRFWNLYINHKVVKLFLKELNLRFQSYGIPARLYIVSRGLYKASPGYYTHKKLLSTSWMDPASAVWVSDESTCSVKIHINNKNCFV